jgi:hypothetical protein
VTDLVPDIEKSLFEHYVPYRDGEAGAPEIASAQDVWTNVSPVGIEIGPIRRGHSIEISFGVGRDEEHTVGAQIQNWKFIHLCGSLPPG